nr:uncharacterized protein LOC109191253 [Ipomoea batatas]
MTHTDLRGGGSDDSDEEGRSVCFWWKSAGELEYEKLRFDTMSNASKVSPRIRLLRELERLGLLSSETLNEIRHKLHSYRPGDFWVPTGGITKEDLEIPAVNTLLLLGFHNAGKTSLVNLMYRVFARSGLLHFAQTPSSSGTDSTTLKSCLFMEEHNVLRSTQSGFCVYDTRGFGYNQVEAALEEVTDWMTNGVHHKKLCLLPGDDAGDGDGQDSPAGSIFATRDVNYAMVVANAWEIYTSLNLGDTTPLEALKKLFHLPVLKNSGENPLLILTHGDKLSTDDRIDSRLKICEFLGVSEVSGAYDVVCVTENGYLTDEYDPISSYSVSEAVYRGLIISDKGHLPKRRFLDWAYLVFVCFMSAFAAIFSFLARICDYFVPKSKLKSSKKLL